MPMWRHFTQEPRNACVRALLNGHAARSHELSLLAARPVAASTTAEPPRGELPYRLCTVNHLAFDPVEFYGPGGLGARRYVGLLESSRKVGELIASSYRADLHPTLGYDRQVLPMAAAQSLSVSELQKRLTEMNVDYSDCLEKKDLVQRYIA
eukprot:CAMPEP_0119541446 /NCGR_PEP_ID=MMETSP1344-20130328/52962_1 /TAXON_ID=236787 /ORGANISM="Florenciella parvula, Strain CCMP2471" /LENGTH=151 /DNA_ID=CAMNT_0007585423 /DNA_START=63 /DNA_END=518 /DNA_ORIENTATION=+